MVNIDKHGKQDAQLLARRLVEGDATAIALIYRKYFHRLLFYGLQVAGNYHKDEVEDVIQEFFVWLAENSTGIAPVKDFESYLFQSIRRNLQSKYTARKRKRASLQRYLRQQPAGRYQMSRSPEQLHIEKEEEEDLQSLIWHQLAQLPDYQREVLYLRYFENRSYVEIADLLSVSQQVAYNYVSRGIKRLKKQLADLVIFTSFWLVPLAVFW